MPPDELPQPPAVVSPVAPAAALPPPAAAPPAAPARRTVVDVEGETPEERATISNIRERERKRALKDAYGTDDPDEIERIRRQRAEDAQAREKEKAELEELRRKQAEAERSKMSETERLQADLKLKDDKIRELELELQKLREETLTVRQESAVKTTAVRHRLKAKPSIMRVVLAEFGAYYLGLTNTEKRRFRVPADAERMLDRWMAKFAKENPEMCEVAPAPKEEKKDETTTSPAVRTPTVVRQPVGAPRRPAAAPPPARSPTTARSPDMDENGKTTKPGLPNSMNSAELAAFKRKQGLKAS